VTDVCSPEAVLSFWFGDGDAPAVLADRWFAGTPALDAEVRQRFAATFDAAERGDLDAWADTPPGAVALVVVLDQFPRHLFRGDARMFATDARARDVAAAALRVTEAPAHLAALHLARVHSEDPDTVAEAVAGLQALVNAPATRRERKRYKGILASARRHLRTLERFGRYPHRNALLGRETTDAEAAWLAADHSRAARSVLRHAPRRLRILVLHSFRQSGRRLASRMRRLEAALEDIAELVYVDAPHRYLPDDAERATLVDDFGEVPDFEHHRCWWNADLDHTVYDGWEASIRHLDAHLPADGVLGFSQGGAVAGLFAALRADRLRFAICISGFPSRAEAHRMLTVPATIDLPSLHVYGEQDVLVTPDRTCALAACFVEPRVLSHPGGHFFPELWPAAELRAFLLAFLDAPPPARQLTDPAWHEDRPLDVVRAMLPAGDALAALLREARLAWPTGRPDADLRAPQPDDRAHRIWLAAWLAHPDVLRAAVGEDADWRALVRLAVRAALDLTPADAAALTDIVAARFVDALAAGDGAAAEAAPRVGSGVDRLTGLGGRIAATLRPGASTGVAAGAYRKRIVALSAPVRAMRRRAQGRVRARSDADPSAPPAIEVTRPRPVPMVPCPLDELEPLLDHLRADAPAATERRFLRGAVTPDGRLDLCKQVVGPDGIRPLLEALRPNQRIDRVLLGNNVIGPDGAEAIAQFVRAGHGRVRVWYVAGNEFDAASVAPLCDAISAAPGVDGLWLKRNPLGPAGAEPVARSIRQGALETLDLVNTGLLDAGAAQVIDALRDNASLRHLYLGTNGLTAAVGPALGRYLAEVDRLHSLFVDCNRLGDEGVAALAEGLAHSRTLRRLSLASNRIGPAGVRALAEALRDHPSLVSLNLGWTRATSAVREAGNRIGDEGCVALAELLRHNAVLRALDVSHNDIGQRGLDTLCEALADNRTLVHLRHPQHGKATNADRVARLRGRVERNRRDAGLDDDAIEAIRTPRAAREVLSVYRTMPMSSKEGP
jgi:uncharacterized protein (DUF924 family)/Ran GTPase-activating protein (RanGAP) involved in mRNA processing and transport